MRCRRLTFLSSQWRSGLLPVNNFGFSVDVFFSTFSSDCLSFLSAAVWWWQPNRRTKTRLAEVPLPHNILLWGSEPGHGMRVLCSITGRDLTLSEGKSLLAEVGGGGGTCTNWFSPTGRSHWGRDDNLRAESWDTGTLHTTLTLTSTYFRNIKPIISVDLMTNQNVLSSWESVISNWDSRNFKFLSPNHCWGFVRTELVEIDQT